VIAARIAAAAIALVLAACADNPVVPGGPKVVPKAALAPYAMHEDCVDLVPNDRLEYRFESSEPVAFDIRYRDGGVVVSPITRQNVTTDAGVFAPLLAKRYCLAWEAGAGGATIGYRMSLRRGVK
jgi:hypothetical protein